MSQRGVVVRHIVGRQKCQDDHVRRELPDAVLEEQVLLRCAETADAEVENLDRRVQGLSQTALDDACKRGLVVDLESLGERVAEQSNAQGALPFRFATRRSAEAKIVDFDPT